MSIIKLLINLTYYLFTGFLFREIIIYGDKKMSWHQTWSLSWNNKNYMIFCISVFVLSVSTWWRLFNIFTIALINQHVYCMNISWNKCKLLHIYNIQLFLCWIRFVLNLAPSGGSFEKTLVETWQKSKQGMKTGLETRLETQWNTQNMIK